MNTVLIGAVCLLLFMLWATLTDPGRALSATRLTGSSGREIVLMLGLAILLQTASGAITIEARRSSRGSA